MPSAAHPPCTPTDLARHPHFTLPDFGYLPSAVYRSDIDAVEHDCRAWLRHHLGNAYPDGVSLERFIEHSTPLWELLVYPTARDDRITEICNWVDYLFSLDDAFVYAPPERARDEHFDLYTQVVNGEHVTARTPYLDTLRGLIDRTKYTMDAPLWSRFTHSLTRFLDAALGERDLQGKAVHQDTYTAYRARSVGVCCFPLAEHGLGIDLTHYLTTSQSLITQLNRLVARHWVYVNDIFSYRKELYSGDTMNEIWLTTQGQPRRLQHAVDTLADHARTIYRELESHCLALARDVPDPSHPVRRYAEALPLMISGNLEWSYLTPRYHGSGFTWDGTRNGTVYLTPQHTIYIHTDSAGA